MPQPGMPTGTVTFLFTDIEGSTRLARTHPAEWEAARQRHHAILRAAVEGHQGHVFQIIGDAFCVAFATAPNALAAALAAQRALQSEAWGETPIRVRMGLHTGAAEFRDGEYHGYLTLAHVQRVMAVAHGEQTLVSHATAGLVSAHLPGGVTLRDLGEQRLKGLPNPERLWQMVAPGLPADFPPLQSLNAIPNNLPVQVTSFVGREKEIAEVKRLLAATRLLTLTGSGGTGKTRLSLQVAAEVLDQFPGGVWFVELAPLADPAFVAQTVATVLGVREQPGRPIMTTLAEHLHDKRLLLILDNCEHLIETCARLADTLQHAAPHLHVLASSREALGIAGETAYRVPSLSLPDPKRLPALESLTQYEAVKLFTERATQAQTTFKVTNANASAVAQICFRLDGIPLAIELAAGRVRSLRIEQIAARLDDRFRLLTGGSRTALPRQQTLRSLIDWSHSLLSEPERVLLRRLSVFAGGWTLEAAEAVTTDDPRRSPAEGLGGGMKDESILPSAFILHPSEVLDLLTRLVDKSLVVLDDQSAEPRYRMLETIRQYAREKLLDARGGTRVRDQHKQYFVALAERARPQLYKADQVTWFNHLDFEHDNLRVAIEWSKESSDLFTCLRLQAALGYFWYIRGHYHELMEHLAWVLSQPADPIQTQTYAFARADALIALCDIGHIQGKAAEVHLAADEALYIGNTLNDHWITGRALTLLARVAMRSGDYATSGAYLEQALAAHRMAEDDQNRLYAGFVVQFLGDSEMLEGKIERARQLYSESAENYRRQGNKNNLAYPLRRLGSIAVSQGNLDVAQVHILESLALNKELGEKQGLIACVAALAALQVARGYGVYGTCLLSAADALLEGIHAKMQVADQLEYEHTLAIVRRSLDTVAFAAAWDAGRALTLDQAVALALEEPNG